MQTNLAKLIRAADVIIWDESPMANKYQINSVDQSLQVTQHSYINQITY